jgi:Mg2+-importing ATPase
MISKKDASTLQGREAFWNTDPNIVLRHLQTNPEGLTRNEASRRLLRYGFNIIHGKKRSDAPTLFLRQFKSPIIILLIFAAVLSIFLHDTIDALIILAIILISGLLGFWQELRATHVIEKLLAIVQTKTTVLRDRKSEDISTENVIPGDIVILNAGDIIPADGLILELKNLFVDEATLTGETYPVEKTVEITKAETPLAQRFNAVWMGTHVISGTAKAVVIRTGKSTEFGKISERLSLRPQETEFEHGVRRFGYFLMEVTLLLIIAIFAINVYLARPVLDSFLFSLALAVGLTPQLLPAIISVNLAHGARHMADKKVIVKRLASIENFGSMNILCSDKTGTLTEGVVHINSTLDLEAKPNEKVLLYAYLNASVATGFDNPIDTAIRAHKKFDITEYKKLDEEPYDFFRKRLSVLVEKGHLHLLITKGALTNIIDVCSSAETQRGAIVDIDTVRTQINQHFEQLSTKGYRILGVAYKDMRAEPRINKSDEADMTFLGFLVLYDPPKADVAKVLSQLKNHGVSFKIITGDSHIVAMNVSQQIGLENPKVLTGPELRHMSENALVRKVVDVNIFAEVEPNQKEHIIRALKKAGNVVGYMGDGINDASALYVADVGISVESAVDVAKEAADIVLLKKDLGVLYEGIREGRVTFANTQKYVFMATSANFGNMFSMAGASLFLPFLPLLPTQILLTNLMTDFPEMTIATDSVDEEQVEKPRRWDIKFIRKFMITFGILSSVFDFMTFGFLIFFLSAATTQFRTGWFVESVVSAALVVLVIRTRKPFFKSKPGKYLIAATLLVVVLTLILPYTLLANLFNFKPLASSFLLAVGVIILFYIISAEITKKIFFKRLKPNR